MEAKLQQMQEEMRKMQAASLKNQIETIHEGEITQRSTIHLPQMGSS